MIGKRYVRLWFVTSRARLVSVVVDLVGACALPAACGRLYKESQGELTAER